MMLEMSKQLYDADPLILGLAKRGLSKNKVAATIKCHFATVEKALSAADSKVSTLMKIAKLAGCTVTIQIVRKDK